MIANLWQDLRFSARMLIKKPSFTLTAVLTLALGIGATATIFSVVNAVLLRPLPYKNSERLIRISETKLPRFPEFAVAAGNFLDWKRQNTSFDHLVAVGPLSLSLTGLGDPVGLRGMRVTEGFLPMLGVQPQLGRDFLPEEDQPDKNNVILLSYGLWQQRFGGNPNIVNQTLKLDGQTHTIVGVMPAGFRFLDNDVVFWKPMGFTAQDAQNHGGHGLLSVGQLKTGVGIERAQTELNGVADRLAQQYPDTNRGWSVKTVSLFDDTVKSVKPALLALLVAVAFVLLIACVNVANLLLARAVGRQKEMAIRAALGAGRERIVRQLLTESLLLACVGGAIGLLLANGGLSLLLRLAPADLPRLGEVALDGRVIAFTGLVTLMTSVLFGLAPAWWSSRLGLNKVMKESGRGVTEGGQRQLFRSSLVVLEIASALVLLICAGLMMKSFWRLLQVDPGFNPERALAVSFELPPVKYADDNKRIAFFQQLQNSVKTLPGVQSVGAVSTAPLSGDDFVLRFEIDGQPPLSPEVNNSTNYYSVSDGYFQSMGIPLLRGRFINEHDTKTAPKVAVINETLARQMFGSEDPLGRRLTFDNRAQNPTWFEIVGVVGNVKHYGLDQTTTMQTYEPYAQQPVPFMTLIVRTMGDPTDLVAAIRREALQLDSEQPVSKVTTLEKLVSTSVSQPQFSMLLLGIFAAVALLLAAVGIYGVLSYAVTQRTNEIGIRMALGASRPAMLRLIVGQGMRLTLIGVVTGVIGAFGLTRLMEKLLFNVSATDPLTFAWIVLLLIGVALLSCFIPARRATKIDPLVALRYE